jgi:hypothetical protein
MTSQSGGEVISLNDAAIKRYAVVRLLKGKPCVQLNLAGSAGSGKYSAGVISKIARRVLKNGVAGPAQSERALCIRRDAKIRMVQEIERFCSKHDLCLSG